jgi:hypothetical protein
LGGNFKGKNIIRIDVQDEEHLKLEGIEAPVPKESVPAVTQSN